jgi:hypothetical protein
MLASGNGEHGFAISQTKNLLATAFLHSCHLVHLREP